MAELKKVRKGDRFGYVNTDTGYVVRIFIVCLKLLNHNSLRYILFQKDYRRTGIVCQDVCQILISEKHSRQTETSANLS